MNLGANSGTGTASPTTRASNHSCQRVSDFQAPMPQVLANTRGSGCSPRALGGREASGERDTGAWGAGWPEAQAPIQLERRGPWPSRVSGGTVRGSGKERPAPGTTSVRPSWKLLPRDWGLSAEKHRGENRSEETPPNKSKPQMSRTSNRRRKYESHWAFPFRLVLLWTLGPRKSALGASLSVQTRPRGARGTRVSQPEDKAGTFVTAIVCLVSRC